MDIDFGKYVAEKRKKAGLTQQEFATAVGLTLRTIKGIEYNETRPSTERLMLWSEVLRVPVAELYEAIGEPVPKNFVGLPSNYIQLPLEFPQSAKAQIETFVKFIQYQKEFDQFLKLYDTYQGEQPATMEEFVNKLIKDEITKKEQAS